jgi:hypothetical protein
MATMPMQQQQLNPGVNLPSDSANPSNDLDQTTQGQDKPDIPDPSGDIPQDGDEAQLLADSEITEDMKKDLMEVRRMLKEANVSKRQVLVRRILRAFEVLKNNPYILFNESNADFDTLSTILSGISEGKDVDLYQYSDNIYQMLCLSFIAALSPDVPKTRFQPVDADDEEDILIAQKASLIQAYCERENGIKALQKLELLYLWTAGSYFVYTRHVIDKNRAGIVRNPTIEMVMSEILPNRYVCSHCGETTPADAITSLQPRCPECNEPLDQSEYYPAENMLAPMKTGYTEEARGMTAMDIYSGLQVDVDPEAEELYDSLYLDLEGEVNIAWVRSQFPGLYTQIQSSGGGDGTSNQDAARLAREKVSSPGPTNGNAHANSGTYSRCWLQPEAFNILATKEKADALKKKFPDGVKLITFTGDIFLQAVPERMIDHWTWCGMLKGLGMYPMGVGDATLDIQTRINDAANTVHAYLDRLAFGTILADTDYIDVDAMASKPLSPGNFTGVKRKDAGESAPLPLEQMLYQPTFHIDPNIYKYESELIQLAQLIAGVQPQTYGGSDPNVKTMGGQAQALKTAMGRLLLFWDQIREEHAKRAKNAVRCSVDNMDDVMKIVVKGDIEGDYRTEKILASELTGEFVAYAESDEGFPSSYQEIQERIMSLLQDQKNPFVVAVLSDPDTQKVVSRYILPDQIKLPNERARTRIKQMLREMQGQAPRVTDGPNGPQTVVLPSMSLNPAYDDIAMAQTIIKGWLQENWRDAGEPGFSNILALLTQATQLVQEQQATAQLQMAAQAGGPGGGPGGPPPGGPPQPTQ